MSLLFISETHLSLISQLGEDVPLTDGKIFIRGNLYARGKLKGVYYGFSIISAIRFTMLLGV